MAKLGTGAQLQLSASAITGSTGLLAELLRVRPPTTGRAAIDVTHHGSTVQEFLAGVVLNQEAFTAEIQWVPGGATDTAIDTLTGTAGLIHFKISIPGSSAAVTYTGQAVLTSFEKSDAEVDGKLTGTLTLQPSGTITKA
jgi:hypothetical protein